MEMTKSEVIAGLRRMINYVQKQVDNPKHTISIYLPHLAEAKKAITFLEQEREVNQSMTFEVMAKEKMKSKTILELCSDYYANFITGGNLHIVLDDGNVENDDIEFCIREAEENNDKDGVIIGKKLLQMSLKEREDFVTAYEYEYQMEYCDCGKPENYIQADFCERCHKPIKPQPPKVELPEEFDARFKNGHLEMQIADIKDKVNALIRCLRAKEAK